MKSNIFAAFTLTLLGVCLAYAGVKIRNQDLPPSLRLDDEIEVNSLRILGMKTNAQIAALTCTAGIGRCLVSSSDEGDLYLNFGTSLGQFRNSRTGKLP